MYGKPPLDKLTHYSYELTFCELAQLVVDYLLHALQDLRYLWSLHKEEKVVVGKWIVITYVISYINTSDWVFTLMLPLYLTMLVLINTFRIDG